MVSSFFFGTPEPLLGWGFKSFLLDCWELAPALGFTLSGAYNGPVVSALEDGILDPLEAGLVRCQYQILLLHFSTVSTLLQMHTSAAQCFSLGKNVPRLHNFEDSAMQRLMRESMGLAEDNEHAHTF